MFECARAPVCPVRCSHQQRRQIREFAEPAVLRSVRTVRAERHEPAFLTDVEVGDASRLGLPEPADGARDAQARARPGRVRQDGFGNEEATVAPHRQNRLNKITLYIM